MDLMLLFPSGAKVSESENSPPLPLPPLSGLAPPSLALTGALLMTWSDIRGKDIGASRKLDKFAIHRTNLHV